MCLATVNLTRVVQTTLSMGTTLFTSRSKYGKLLPLSSRTPLWRHVSPWQRCQILNPVRRALSLKRIDISSQKRRKNTQTRRKAPMHVRTVYFTSFFFLVNSFLSLLGEQKWRPHPRRNFVLIYHVKTRPANIFVTSYKCVFTIRGFLYWAVCRVIIIQGHPIDKKQAIPSAVVVDLVYECLLAR